MSGVKQITFATETKTYYEKTAVNAISQMVRDRIYKMADEIAEDLIARYQVKEALSTITAGDEGQIVLTVILTPKGEKDETN